VAPALHSVASAYAAITLIALTVVNVGGPEWQPPSNLDRNNCRGGAMSASLFPKNNSLFLSLGIEQEMPASMALQSMRCRRLLGSCKRIALIVTKLAGGQG
jgi:hypothetical protein